MKYYLERREGQNELVLINGLDCIRIELSGDWAQVVENAMVQAGAQVVEHSNMKEYRL